ncbi:MAG: hypothetical protein ACK40N_10070 [Meiothermus ruber]|jgi:hypothetical protein|uniref:Outer membrane protein beta-barrel domain-containing protein n=1 Tax=Meiothermus ruber TaxID=277 RepID=A0A7C3HVP8_MEIRU|nr:hypothetical protein [Meiothermus sp.]GIW27421.1 MAG: hypothetical protein KatS3mg070_0784 [Meiothermus sp.]
MKKLLVLFVAMVLGGAFAQGRLFGEVASGNMALVPNFGLSVSARMGAENALGPLALRGGFGLQTSSGGTAFGIGADALYFLRNPGLDFYFGGGLGLQAGGTTVFVLSGAAGLELPVSGNFNFLVELKPALYFAGGSSQFGLDVEFGPRLYFR